MCALTWRSEDSFTVNHWVPSRVFLFLFKIFTYLKKDLLVYFVNMNAFPVCTFLYCVSAWCLRSPGEGI